MHIRELARRRGKNLGQLGLAAPYASAINTGRFRAGADAIAAIAQALGEPPERIAEICDACWQAGEARRAAASAPPASSPAPAYTPAIAYAPSPAPAGAPAGKGW